MNKQKVLHLQKLINTSIKAGKEELAKIEAEEQRKRNEEKKQKEEKENEDILAAIVWCEKKLPDLIKRAITCKCDSIDLPTQATAIVCTKLGIRVESETPPGTHFEDYMTPPYRWFILTKQFL